MKNATKCFLIFLFYSYCNLANANPSELLSIEVALVRISATRPGTAQNWVIPGKPASNSSCALLANGLGAATGVGLLAGPQMASIFCQPPAKASSARVETDPNIYIRIKSDKLLFKSYTVEKTRSQSFDFKMIFPSQGIPKTGLVLEVINDDGSGDEKSQEVIGQFRFQSAELIKAADSGNPITKSDGGVEKIEIIVRPEEKSEIRRATGVDVQKGLVSFDDLPVFAGQVVEVSSGGFYRAEGAEKPIGPAGYSGKGLQYPDEPFKSGPLGGALVRIGGKRLLKGYLVNPCVSFISPFQGTLAVGINNAKPGTARGDLKFNVRVREANEDEWKKGEATKCGATSVASEDSNKPDFSTLASKVQTLLKGNAGVLAKNILSILHPTGVNPNLKSYDVNTTEVGVEATITTTWNGGILGDPYQTTIRWELNNERQIGVQIMADTAKIKVSEKAKNKLNEYFLSTIEPMVRK
jgi:hypothetical protein